MHPSKCVDWLLWGLAVVYLAAFSSLFYQIPSMFADPMKSSFCVPTFYQVCTATLEFFPCNPSSNAVSLHERLLARNSRSFVGSSDALACALSDDKASILHGFTTVLNLSPADAMAFACLLGIFLSSLAIVFRAIRGFASFLTLWYLYFSVFQVWFLQSNHTMYTLPLCVRSGRRSCGSNGIHYFSRLGSWRLSLLQLGC